MQALNDRPTQSNKPFIAILAIAASFVLAVLVLAATEIIDLGGIEGDVAELVDKDVDCEKAGVMLIAGERETVYSCAEADSFGFASVGCFAEVDGEVYDVSVQAEALATLQSSAVGC